MMGITLRQLYVMYDTTTAAVTDVRTPVVGLGLEIAGTEPKYGEFI